MAGDIFATLTAYNTSPQTVESNSRAANTSGNLDNKFAGLMNECLTEAEEVLTGEIKTLLPAVTQQVTAFTGNNSFAQSVIDILAGEPLPVEGEPVAESTDNDAVIWPEGEEPETVSISDEMSASYSAIKQAAERIAAKVKDFLSESAQNIELSDADVQQIAEKILHDGKAEELMNNLPAELQQEIRQAVNDIAARLTHNDGADTQPVVKILGAVAERLTAAENTDSPDETEDESEENTELAESIAGLAVAADTLPQTQTPNEQQNITDSAQAKNTAGISRNLRQVRAAKSQAQPEETATSSDSQQTGANFREALANRITDNEDTDSQPQNQNFSQGRDESGTGDSSSQRQRTSQKVTSRTQANDTDTTSANARRTESRSDFQSFFEGVLTSRRTVSRTSEAEPLSLRGTENFTQASALRNGIVNVVRFIRADGVQKARVVVDPPALGRVSVELTSGTSGVEASIKVASEQIRQLIQDQLSELRMNLSQQGVQVAEFTVDVQQDNSGSQQNNQQEQNQYVSFADDSDDGETEEFRVDLEDGLLYWVA